MPIRKKQLRLNTDYPAQKELYDCIVKAKKNMGLSVTQTVLMLINKGDDKLYDRLAVSRDIDKINEKPDSGKDKESDNKNNEMHYQETLQLKKDREDKQKNSKEAYEESLSDLFGNQFM